MPTALLSVLSFDNSLLSFDEVLLTFCFWLTVASPLEEGSWALIVLDPLSRSLLFTIVLAVESNSSSSLLSLPKRDGLVFGLDPTSVFGLEVETCSFLISFLTDFAGFLVSSSSLDESKRLDLTANQKENIVLCIRKVVRAMFCF